MKIRPVPRTDREGWPRAVLLLAFLLPFLLSLPWASRAGEGPAGAVAGVMAGFRDAKEEGAVSLLWTFRSGGEVDSSPALSEDGKILFFSSWDHRLYALDAESGREAWSFDLGDFADATPAVSGGKVWGAAWNRLLVCLDGASGKELWRQAPPPSPQDDHRQASPVLSGSLVIHGGFDGVLRAFDSASGRPAWRLATGGAFRSRPDPAGYAGSGDGSLYAFDPRTGAVRWYFPTGGAVHVTPAVHDGRVIFPSRDGFLYAADEVTGALLWKYDGGGRVEYSSPLLHGALVVYGDCRGTVHGVEAATGRGRWTFRADGPVYAPPVAAGQFVAVADNDGSVHFLDPRDGRRTARFRAAGAVQGLSSSPGGTVYAASRDRSVYAIRLDSHPRKGTTP